jgi:hypothetical protein
MLKTKNVLMLVVLSAGMLTALTGTGVSQLQSEFADEDDECEENDDKNCNKKETEQTNDCRIEVDNSNNEGGTSENNGGLSTLCSDFAANPDEVDEQSQVGQEGQTLEPETRTIL